MKEQNLTIRHIDILHLVNDGFDTNSKIAKRLKIPRSTAKRPLDQLLDMGFLRKIIAGTSRVYELTSIGNEAVTKFLAMSRSEKNSPKGFRVHNVRWSSVIERQPWKLNDDLKKNNFVVSNMTNWAQYTWNNKEEGVTIVFTPKKVHFFIEEIWTDSPMEYYPVAQKKLLSVAKGLENKFPGLTLGSPERVFMIHKQHVANVGPLSKLAAAYELQTGKQVTYHGDRVHLDKSKGYYEEETVDNQSAPIDMENLVDYFNEWTKTPFWPGQIKLLEDKSVNLESQQKDFSSVVDVLGDRLSSLSDSHSSLKTNFSSVVDVLGDRLSSLSDSHSSLRKDFFSRFDDLESSIDSNNKSLFSSIVVLSREHEILSDGMLILQNGQSVMNDRLHLMTNVISGLSGNVKDISGVVGDVAESINVFGVAMREHVALVTELQSVTRGFKSAWESSLIQQNSFNERVIRLIDKNNSDLTAAILELATPWYVKFARAVKKLFSNKS